MVVVVGLVIVTTAKEAPLVEDAKLRDPEPLKGSGDNEDPVPETEVRVILAAPPVAQYVTK